MTAEEYRSKKEEVIKKFSYEFILKHYKTDPTIHHIIELLILDKDPYEIIERLIEDRVEYTKRFQEYILYHSQPIVYKP